MVPPPRKYDVIVIGSGAGGATVARELARRGADLLVLEKGPYYSGSGTFEDILQFHDAKKITKAIRYSEEGIMLLRTFMAGGSTYVSCGNGVRCLEDELRDLDLHLEDELAEAEKELSVAPIPDEWLSAGSMAIRRAAEELGYSMELMPKFIDPEKCINCGKCYSGCDNDAKWTSLDFIEQAANHGADIIYERPVQKILVQEGRARGVLAGSRNGTEKIYADRVVLSAGGLSTPSLLRRVGIGNAGSGLFVDTFVNVYGETEGLNQLDEVPMALYNREFYKEEGFILSTFFNSISLSRFAELGIKALVSRPDRLIGLMVKIRDERSGGIHPNGKITKPVTGKDREKLDRGISVAKDILAGAGAIETSFAISVPQGAHPGGTAAIGEIVDHHLETEIRDLYVCDGSVLPVSPGLPPILTIIALGKHLAKELS